MITKILKTEQEYEDVCERIYKLINEYLGTLSPDDIERFIYQLKERIIQRIRRDQIFYIQIPEHIEVAFPECRIHF